MKATFVVIVGALALAPTPLLAQATHTSAAPMPSVMSRIKAAAQAPKPTTAPESKPAPVAKNMAQGARTPKSLACSAQADKQNIHGKARKSFMSHCKKA